MNAHSDVITEIGWNMSVKWDSGKEAGWNREDETQGNEGMAAQGTEDIGFKILPILQKIQQDDSHKNFSGQGLSQTQILTFNFMSQKV